MKTKNELEREWIDMNRDLKTEKFNHRLTKIAMIAFFILCIIFAGHHSLKHHQEDIKHDGKNYLNNKYLFCEYYGGVYSSHGNDECAFGKYPNDIYPEIKMKKEKWEFKNPLEVLEYFAFSLGDEDGSN